VEAEHLSLVQSARQGDLRAFNRLSEAYQDSIYNLACRALSDETAGSCAAQQAFLSAFRDLRRYRDGSWRAWLYRCTIQACQKLLHRQAGDLSEGPRRRPNGEIDLSDLPWDLRLVLALVDLEGLDYEETAAILDISPLKVKSRLARARRQLAIGARANAS
jgi:RNA polymerase sigma-70 factor (ECF subfamily)